MTKATGFYCIWCGWGELHMKAVAMTPICADCGRSGIRIITFNPETEANQAMMMVMENALKKNGRFEVHCDDQPRNFSDQEFEALKRVLPKAPVDNPPASLGDPADPAIKPPQPRGW